MSELTKFPLTALSREYKAYSGREVPGGYRRLWNLVVNGQIPAEQVNGRYLINRSDLPSVADALGMPRATTKTSAAA